ncbi:hypothetical protein [Streptomyces canus]|uniref:hypothetical protein n=1 Tax=Streptomyces canus TaxID=58343 RepID=UPI0003666ABB|nr:hypothetical protein [Streptomyces canus]
MGDWYVLVEANEGCAEVRPPRVPDLRDELVASKEPPPAQRPAAKKGVLRRALGRD